MSNFIHGDYYFIEIPELNGLGFVFDKDGYELFKTQFYGKDDLLFKCPQCGENKECNKQKLENEGYHNYSDCFICFKCKFKQKYNTLSDRYYLSIVGAYLVRIEKNNLKKIEYWHRFLMDKEIKEYTKGRKELIEVHHLNQHPNDNRKINLEVMTSGEHLSLHEQVKDERGFITWCEKVHGTLDYIYYDDFLEWKSKKEGY